MVMARRFGAIDAALIAIVLGGLGTLTASAMHGPAARISRASLVQELQDLGELPTEPVLQGAAPKLVPGRDEAEKDRERTHEVFLTADGLLRGKVILIDASTEEALPVEDVRIQFLQQGRTLANVKPGPGAIFQVPGLEPGVYGCVASGVGAFAAFSFRVLPFDRQNADGAGGVLEIEMTGVPPRDFPAVRELAESYLGESDRWKAFDRDLVNYGGEFEPSHTEPGNQGQGAVPDNDLKYNVVELTPEGVLVGSLEHIHPVTGDAVPAAEINVFLIRNNDVIASGITDDNGVFSIPGVRPGYLSLVAVSAGDGEPEQFWSKWLDGRVYGGFGALGVLVVSSQSKPDGVASIDDKNAFRLVKAARNMNRIGGNRLQMGLLDPSNFPQVLNALNQQQGAGGGGAAGAGPGATGGGAGIVGGSDLGTLLGLAGLAAGIVALADDSASTNPSPDGD